MPDRRRDFATAIEVLREKAEVYEDHPDYRWMLPDHEPAGLGHVIAFELRSTADMLEWINERQVKREAQRKEMEEIVDEFLKVDPYA